MCVKTKWISQQNAKYNYLEKILSISCYNLRSMAIGGLLQIVFGILIPSKNADLLLGTKDSGKGELCTLTYTLSQDAGSDKGS